MAVIRAEGVSQGEARRRLEPRLFRTGLANKSRRVQEKVPSSVESERKREKRGQR